jgi:hypothetical protein
MFICIKCSGIAHKAVRLENTMNFLLNKCAFLEETINSFQNLVLGSTKIFSDQSIQNNQPPLNYFSRPSFVVGLSFNY